MRAPNTPFGLELLEFFDIPRSERPANPWDPGASILTLQVRDLESILSRLDAAGAVVVTLGGGALETPAGRAIVVRSPDGYLIRVNEAAPAELAAATESGAVVGASIGLTVADSDRALGFYRDLLGFEVADMRRATAAELHLYGLSAGMLTQTTMLIPGADVAVTLAQFELSPSGTKRAHPYRWRIQDVGAPQFQLEVAALDALLERTRRAGYRFLSVGGEPIHRPFGRFVFVIDPDGALVEFVEPAVMDPVASLVFVALSASR